MAVAPAVIGQCFDGEQESIGVLVHGAEMLRTAPATRAHEPDQPKLKTMHPGARIAFNFPVNLKGRDIRRSCRQ